METLTKMQKIINKALTALSFPPSPLLPLLLSNMDIEGENSCAFIAMNSSPDALPSKAMQLTIISPIRGAY